MALRAIKKAVTSFIFTWSIIIIPIIWVTFSCNISIRMVSTDDYLFNKETLKSGLKRKREPENIVGTKKSKY